MNMDFGPLDSDNVLENFDFESFRHTDDDMGGLQVESNLDFESFPHTGDDMAGRWFDFIKRRERKEEARKIESPERFSPLISEGERKIEEADEREPSELKERRWPEPFDSVPELFDSESLPFTDKFLGDNKRLQQFINNRKNETINHCNASGPVFRLLNKYTISEDLTQGEECITKNRLMALRDCPGKHYGKEKRYNIGLSIGPKKTRDTGISYVRSHR